jgi:hypothetical protein
MAKKYAANLPRTLLRHRAGSVLRFPTESSTGPVRGRTAGEISMVNRTGRLEVNGTFMAHKSGKSCSPVSASVNEPRTNRQIANILNGYLPFF